MKERFVLLVGIALAALMPVVALAHGGGTPILTRVESGPYWLYVFSQSPEPQAGSPYHVSVAVTQPQGNGNEIGVEDAGVTVHFVSATGETVSADAAKSVEGPGYYEADVTLPAGGAWQASVAVVSPLGEGNAAWTVQVAAPGGVRWSWVIAGIVLVLAGLGVLGYAFTRRGAPPEEAEAEIEPVAEAVAATPSNEVKA